jgi:hypothetical protein
LSADGGKTWTAVRSTSNARANLSGVTPATTIGVEVCISDSHGTAEWSQMVTLLVK